MACSGQSLELSVGGRGCCPIFKGEKKNKNNWPTQMNRVPILVSADWLNFFLKWRRGGGGGDGVSQPETSEKKGTYEISPHGAHVPGYLSSSDATGPLDFYLFIFSIRGCSDRYYFGFIPSLGTGY